MANAPAPSRSLLFLRVALSVLGEVSAQLINPGLGAIEQALMALSAFVAAFGLGQLLFGPLSDRIGRRPVLIGVFINLLGFSSLEYGRTVLYVERSRPILPSSTQRPADLGCTQLGGTP